VRVHVPEDVARAVTNRWPERGQAWRSRVEAELSRLCTRYDAVPISVFPSRYGLVVEVSVNGSLLVMRSSPDPQGSFQAKVATALARLGVAPGIHEVIQSETGTWTIMDRILPGTTWIDAPSSLDAIAAMLQPLNGQPAPVSGMPSLTEWLASRLADDEPADLPHGRSPASPAQRKQATGILETLATVGSASLCHGDVSRRNVLADADGRLLLIDPRGVAGDPCYDVAVVAMKTAAGEEPLSRAGRLARLIGSDPERAQAWVTVADAARV
jgi:streptomycin 6-kinase